MNKHYLAHVIRTHHAQKESNHRVTAAKAELHKAFSKEHLTATLRKRLLARRRRDEVRQQLEQLEAELLTAHSDQRDRVERLLANVQRLKKKAEKS